jgi:hypothetical protein
MLHAYLEIITDPAHMLAELSLALFVDVLVVLGAYKWLFKGKILPRITKSVHADIDREHGIIHDEPVTYVQESLDNAGMKW